MQLSAPLPAQAPVATAWLCREEKRNALGAPVLASIEEAFLFLHTRFDIDVVVLAGRGKSFSAGAEVATGGFAPGDPDATGPSSASEPWAFTGLSCERMRCVLDQLRCWSLEERVAMALGNH